MDNFSNDNWTKLQLVQWKNWQREVYANA